MDREDQRPEHTEMKKPNQWEAVALAHRAHSEPRQSPAQDWEKGLWISPKGHFGVVSDLEKIIRE